MTGLLWKYAALAFAIGGTILVIVVYIVTAQDAKRALDDAKTHIETREDIDNALSADRDCPWYDRLQSSCD